jgi:multidrug efflux pump
LLKPVAKGHHHAKEGVFGWFNRKFGKVTDRYVGLNSAFVKKTGRYMAIYLGILLILGFLYSRLPESFIPAEDQGYYIVDVQLPSGATYQRQTQPLRKWKATWRSEKVSMMSSQSWGSAFQVWAKTPPFCSQP